MATSSLGPWTFWQRWLVGQELRHDAGLPPPPTGYDSWLQYLEALQIGGSFVSTFAPPDGIPRGRKVSMVFTREGEDVATIGMHFLHRDGTDVTDFSNADSATIEDHLLTMWDSLKGQYTATIALDRLVWHPFGVGVRRPNPQVRETNVAGGSPGTHIGTDPLPPQCATSVTFKTSARRNWGRVYLPATIEGNVTEGRFIVGWLDTVRDSFGTLLDSAAGDDLPLVVWCPRHDGKLLQFFKRDADHPTSAHELELDLPDSSSFARTVDVVQVDDIVDTIRSRRFATPLLKGTHTLA